MASKPVSVRVMPAERPLGHGLDLFHTSKEALPVLTRAWQRVEGYWQRAEQAEAELALAKAPESRSDARGPAKRAAAAWERVREQWDWYDRQERGWKQARRALDLFCPDGQLNDPEWAKGQIEQACQALSAKRWEKVRRWLRDGRTTARASSSTATMPETGSLAPLTHASWWLPRTIH